MASSRSARSSASGPASCSEFSGKSRGSRESVCSIYSSRLKGKTRIAAPAQIDAPPCKPSHGIFAGCSRRHATLLAFSAASRLNWLTRDRKGLKGPRRNCALTAIRHHLGDFWWSLCVRAVAEGTSGGFFLGWGPIELSSVHERQPHHDVRGRAGCACR